MSTVDVIFVAQCPTLQRIGSFAALPRVLNF